MAGHHAPYAPEFRREMVELVRSGRSPQKLSRQFEPSTQAIRNWGKQAHLDEGRRSDKLTIDEREELRRLKRDNRPLRLEHKVLTKAAAWFGRESGSIPRQGSSSRRPTGPPIRSRSCAACWVSPQAGTTPG